MPAPAVTACIVSTDSGEHPGRVLAWWQESGAWWAVVRFVMPDANGFRLGYERRVPASALRPREV